jgi:hypothetical protein
MVYRNPGCQWLELDFFSGFTAFRPNVDVRLAGSPSSASRRLLVFPFVSLFFVAEQALSFNPA